MDRNVQSEAILAYLTDLHNLVRFQSPTLVTIVRVLSEPLSFLGLASADTVKWAGPVESTQSRRQYFVQHLLSNHLDFILDHITIDWLSALPSSDQAALFDIYFVPTLTSNNQEKSTSPRSPEFHTTIAMVSLQTLVGRLNARFHENHTFLNQTILRLLQRLLKTFTLADYYHAMISNNKADSTRNPGSNKADVSYLWDPFLAKLLSIPTNIANVYGVSRSGSGQEGGGMDSLDPLFQETVFFERQSSQLIQCLEESATVNCDDDERIQYSQVLGTTIGKLMRMGYGRILVETMFAQMWDPPSDTHARGWRQALGRVPPGVARTFLLTVVEQLQKSKLNFDNRSHMDLLATDRLSAVHRGTRLLVNLGYGSDDQNSSLVDDILFQGRVFYTDVLRVLICVQSGWPSSGSFSKDSALVRTFMKALSVWSDAMFIKRSSAEYQKYLSYQILLSIGYLDTSLLLELDAKRFLYTAMQAWLDLENFERKAIGLMVAEEFSKRMDPAGMAADFDLPKSDPEILFGRALVEVKDGLKPFQPTASQVGDAEGNQVPIDNTVSDPESDEDDPDAIVNPYSSGTSRPLNDFSDNDSDDDLQPYDMDDDESDDDQGTDTVKRPKATPPLYLRDLLAYLRASEDRQKVEIALEIGAELIRRKAGSLEIEEFAELLATAFVRLQDTFELENFYKLREAALIALVASAPKITAGVLALEFYKRENSLGQRLNVLSALALGARELSGFDRTLPNSTAASSANVTSRGTTGSKTGAKTPPEGSVVKQSPLTFNSITSSISLAKTRRFSQKSDIEARRPLPKANPFANLAPLFLGALLGRWGGNRGAGNERGYDAMQRAPVMVLKKFVMTLGVMVYYAGNSPHLLSMTRELLRFLMSLRYHIPPELPTPSPLSFSTGPNSGSKPSPTAEETLAAMMTASFLSPTTPSLTTLKMPDQNSSSTSGSLTGPATTVPYNAELVESLLFGMLILLTPPSSETLPDKLLLNEFYPEIMECHQWALEIWDILRAEEQGEGGGAGGEKARMYCASLLKRGSELLNV
ncbi:telomere binding protein [Gryganskiella cystojenkinii]|nr:telomere binding protein [Gryganskiella cystojenkinii]